MTTVRTQWVFLLRALETMNTYEQKVARAVGMWLQATSRMSNLSSWCDFQRAVKWIAASEAAPTKTHMWCRSIKFHTRRRLCIRGSRTWWMFELSQQGSFAHCKNFAVPLNRRTSVLSAAKNFSPTFRSSGNRDGWFRYFRLQSYPSSSTCLPHSVSNYTNMWVGA